MLRYIIIFALISVSFAQKNVRIIYSGDISGYLEACNCPGNLFGGLIYADEVINKQRKKNENTLILDAGDLFPAANWEKNARYAMKFYNLMQVTALNIGDQEFWFGKEYLIAQKSKVKFVFLSANIFEDDSLLFKPYIIKTIGDKKIAIAGIACKEAFNALDSCQLSDIKIKAVDQILPPLIKKLKSISDLIILLSHCGLIADKKLAQKYQDIDFIIGAHSHDTLKEPLKIGAVSILHAGSYAHYLGVLDINFNRGSKYTFKHKLIKLKDVPLSERANALYKKYKADKEHDVPCLEQRHIPNPNYIAAPSAEDCGKCHFNEYNQWVRTPHAHAWETIEKDGRTNDKSCISCHTTLFEKNRGFVNLQTTPQLVNVTCVSCHTEFEGHSEDNPSFEPVKKETCLECHKPANSPDFTYKSYLPAVMHNLRYYTIKSGDWLSKIAKKYYYNIYLWKRIFRANMEQISDPNKIYPGQRIVIPVVPDSKHKKN